MVGKIGDVMARKSGNSGHRDRRVRGYSGGLSSDEVAQMLARLDASPVSRPENILAPAAETPMPRQTQAALGLGRLVSGACFAEFLQELEQSLPGFQRRQDLYVPYFTVSAARRRHSADHIVSMFVDAKKLDAASARSELTLTSFAGRVINTLNKTQHSPFRVAVRYTDSTSEFYTEGFQITGEKRVIVDELDPRNATGEQFPPRIEPSVTINLGRCAAVGANPKPIIDAVSRLEHLLPAQVTLGPIGEVPA